MFYIIGSILNFISYLILWISRFFSNKKSILLMDIACKIVGIFSFIFLDTLNGLQNTIYAIIRNIIGEKVIGKSNKVKYALFSIMLFILFIMYYISFNGLSTICVAVCGVLNLIGVILCNEQGLRLCGIVGSLFFASFLILTGNIIGFICEVITFLSNLLSWLKFLKTE